MKYKHLERYKVTLETVSPVFIGSADSFYQKEIICLPNESMVIVPDLCKLAELIEKKGSLGVFEQYLLDQNDRRPLKTILQELGIPVSVNAPWVKYKLRNPTGDIRINKLSCFVRNHQGMPYIPGASIKGAIRTALIASKGNDRTFLSVKATAERYPKQRQAGDEENTLRTLKLNKEPKNETDAVNDLLRCLEVSDSAPFGDNSLIVCKKLELTKEGKVNGVSSEGFRGKSSPPLYRECLRPGLKTHFYITIDRSLAKGELTVDVIKNALKQWQRVQNEYTDRFDYWRIDLRGLETAGIPIILGGGVGFQSKSLLMKLKEGRDSIVHFVLDAQFNKKFEKRYKPAPGDPAPYRMKLAQYNGSFYPMGRCSLTVEE